MKKIILYLSVFALGNAFAQTYTEITGIPFTAGTNPSMEFFDKDGDGDKDVMICAYDNASSAPFSNLYENDGAGNFTLVTGPFEGINLGDLAIGDLDGDNDLDMITIGRNSSNNASTKVYLNDGAGLYTEKVTTGLPSIGRGCAELGDLDGDGDLDLYIDGATNTTYPYSNYTGLFINDGTGLFTQNTSNTFLSRSQSTKIIDLDNDGKLDIISSGGISGIGYGTDFYKNTGNLNFNTRITISTYGGEIGLIDINNDNAIDMIIGGNENGSTSGTFNKVVDVFLNDGNASFTKVIGNSFGQFNDIYFSVNDFDGNGTDDITLVGWGSPNSRVAKQYLNNGSGVFSENTNASFTGVRNGNIISEDINGNGSLEILILGYAANSYISELYEDESNPCTVNIPDANFKAYLVGNTSINTNGNTEIECGEATAFTGQINCATMGVNDMTGIEAFTGVTDLRCNSNNITSLDISNNTALTFLSCSANQLTNLDISQNTLLETLGCGNNQLTNLDITNNVNLIDLHIYQNGFTSVDVSSLSNLTYLNCVQNSLTSLNIANGNNTNFTGLDASSNPNLTCIQVDDVAYSTTNWTNIDATASFSTNCTSCTVNIPDANFKAYLVGNTSINTNGNTEIECSEASSYTGAINCQNLSISDMTGIEAFTMITSLSCRNNNISTINLSQNTMLGDIDCAYNSLTSLDLSQNINLSVVYCFVNQIATLDLSQNTALETLSAGDNPLTSIDITQNVVLDYLILNNAQLASINIANNPALYFLQVNSNQLTQLDVSNNTSLEALQCTNNQLTSLDFSNNAVLTTLHCYNNTLTSLDMANGNNTNVTSFQSANNPNLTCIQVDDAAYSTTNWTSIDAASSFSTNCATSVGVNESKSEASELVKLYPNPTNGLVTFEANEKVKSIEVYSLAGQKVAQFNNQKTIDISSLPNGIYTARVTIGDSNPIVKRLIKN